MVVVAELVGATGGVGYELLQQQQIFDMAGAVAWTLVLVIFVLVVQGIITLVESHVCATAPLPSGVVSASPEILFERVSKAFPRPGGGMPLEAVRELSFAIARGELVAILGKTGCGKSTTFNLIAGLMRPSAGRILVQGHDPYADFASYRGKIGIIFRTID